MLLVKIWKSQKTKLYKLHAKFFLRIWLNILWSFGYFWECRLIILGLWYMFIYKYRLDVFKLIKMPLWYAGTMALNGQVAYEPGYICRGAGAYATNANMGNWCLLNCALNNCPSTHCYCKCFVVGHFCFRMHFSNLTRKFNLYTCYVRFYFVISKVFLY